MALEKALHRFGEHASPSFRIRGLALYVNIQRMGFRNPSRFMAVRRNVLSMFQFVLLMKVLNSPAGICNQPRSIDM
jgi:hypothetical protein